MSTATRADLPSPKLPGHAQPWPRLGLVAPNKVLATAGAALCLALLLATVLLDVDNSYWLIVAGGAVVGLAIASLEAPPDRIRSAALFICALAMRMLAVTTLFYLASRQGGPFLGPDSSKYWSGSFDLAERAFHLEDIPQVYFGTFDVSHYYLFAALIRFADADVFGLQVLNSVLSALAVPFLFGATRVAVPRAAVPVAALAAFAPSLIALSSIDLLKDASILCGMVALVWAVVGLTREERVWRIAVYALTGVVVGLYLHTARFYSFAYIEFAFIAALVFVRLVCKLRVFRRPAALVAACSIFVIGESLPMRAEWPPSPVMVTAMVKYTLGTPDLFFYSAGLFSKVNLRNREVVEDRGGVGLVEFAANLFRRMYGPFVWILPSRWNFRALQSAEFFLYPGTLLWYALIPFILVGIGVAGWRIATRREVEFAIVFLWLFTAMYFFQYLLINLSYRQRDVMQPLLLVFAFIGLTAARSLQQWPRWYARYWILLAVIAGSHLAVRAFLRL